MWKHDDLHLYSHIDILGYGIDDIKMTDFLAECYGGVSREEIQIRQLADFYKYAEKYGLILAPMEELVWDRSREWASIVFYKELKRHQENKTKVPEDLWAAFINFKRKYYNKKGAMFYIDRSKDYPSIDKIVDIIHRAGGLAFVAHVYEYTWMDDKRDELKLIKEEFNIDGVECYYNSFSREQTKGLVELCRNENLLMSGGSDYHGFNRPEIELGIGRGNLAVPDDIIYNWLEKS